MAPVAGDDEDHPGTPENARTHARTLVQHELFFRAVPTRSFYE